MQNRHLKDLQCENYQPSEESSDSKNYRRKRSKQRGHFPWSLQENLIYAHCLLEMLENFDNQFARRSQRVFRKISSCLKNRTPEQCRSHHQKMMKSYKSIEGIFQHFKKLNGAQEKSSLPDESNTLKSEDMKEFEENEDFFNTEEENARKQMPESLQMSKNLPFFINENGDTTEYHWDDVFNF